MRQMCMATGLMIVAGGLALGQPPRGSERPGDERGRGQQREPREERTRGENPLVNALDTNGDKVISAEEIQAAAAVLLKLDKNSNGQLDPDEYQPSAGYPEGRRPEDGSGRPPQGPPDGFGPPGPPPRGPREVGLEDGPSGRGRGPGGPEGPRRGPGPEGRGPGPEGRGPEGRGPGRPGPGFGGPEGRGPEFGEGPGPGGSGPGPGGPGPRPDGRGPEGKPDPKRFVAHAMEFDADKDGMLNRDELLKFAEEFAAHQGPGGMPGPGRDGRRPDRPAPPDRPSPDRPDRPAPPDRPVPPDRSESNW